MAESRLRKCQSVSEEGNGCSFREGHSQVFEPEGSKWDHGDPYSGAFWMGRDLMDGIVDRLRAHTDPPSPTLTSRQVDLIREAANTIDRVEALASKWMEAKDMTTGNPSAVARAFAYEVRKAVKG